MDNEKIQREINLQNNEMKALINEITELFYNEVEMSIDILLNMAKCKERYDAKKLQIELLEKGYDLTTISFKNNPTKKFVYLSNIKGKFIKGYLIELNFETYKIERSLIKSRKKFEEIIKN